MKNNFCETERKRYEKMKKFQLPYSFKKIGWSIVIITFLLMIVKKFIDEPSWVKPLLQNLLILGFLVVSLAKEKIEDEWVDSLRVQSYRLAFITGVVYFFVQPYVQYGVSYLIRSGEASISFNYFQVLSFMLLVQILFFYQSKKWGS